MSQLNLPHGTDPARSKGEEGLCFADVFIFIYLFLVIQFMCCEYISSQGTFARTSE